MFLGSSIQTELTHARRKSVLPDLIPSPRIDSRKTVQVRQIRRRDDDCIDWLAGERRLRSKDGIGIESVRRCRRYAKLAEESPELGGLDDRVGRQGQVS
jgi:hypothetical protein